MTKSPRKRGLAGPKPKPGPLNLNECVPHAPRKKEIPQWEDMNGDMHHDEGECRDANMKYVLTMIVERDIEVNADWLGHGGSEEEVVEFLLRNRSQIIVAACARGENGGSVPGDDVNRAFEDFMRAKFGKGWRENQSDDGLALISGMREAFIAGQAWYCKR